MACGLNFASRAKNKIVIQKLKKIADAYGGQQSGWIDASNCWAIVEPSSGKEVFYSEQIQSRVTHKIMIRYESQFADTKLAGALRIRLDGRLFSVKFVRNLDTDGKSYGYNYQEFMAEDNGPEVIG